MENKDKKQKNVQLPFFLWIPAYQRRKNLEIFESLDHLNDIVDHIVLPVSTATKLSLQDNTKHKAFTKTLNKKRHTMNTFRTDGTHATKSSRRGRKLGILGIEHAVGASTSSMASRKSESPKNSRRSRQLQRRSRCRSRSSSTGVVASRAQDSGFPSLLELKQKLDDLCANKASAQ